MIRELVLVSSDFAPTQWFAGRVPPPLPLPPGFVLRNLLMGEQGLCAIGPVPPAQAARRLSEGDTCIVAIGPDEGLAGQMWCSEKPRFIDWIGCNIRPPDGHVHIYNSWIRPEYRGLGLQWNLATSACADVLARGRTKMCAGVERKEYPPFARKYAAMGLGHLAPYKSLWALRVLGTALVAIPAPPPRHLEEACRNAGKIFARQAKRV